MGQRAVRAEGTPPPPPAGRPSAEAAEGLGRDWVVLRDCRLGPPSRGGDLPTVLMHPARGVAVLDVLPGDTPGAAEALRARLEAARFPAIFAGHLPVVHLQVTPRRLQSLSSLLDEAFAAQPPLDLPGGDAWVGAAARALRAEQQPVRRPEASRHPDAAAVRRSPGRRRGTGTALRAAGAVLLCSAALGGVLGLALNRVPAPVLEAQPGAAALPPASFPEAAPATVAPSPRPAAETADRAPPVPPPVLDSVPAAPAPLHAPAARGEADTPVRPVPAARQPGPPSMDTTSVPEPALQLQQAPPVPPPPPPSRRPEAAVPPQQPSAAKRAGERAAPPRRQHQDAGTAQPAATANDAAPRSPEAAPDRCRRVSALVGSGAPLAEADMRFFNENCIRW